MPKLSVCMEKTFCNSKDYDVTEEQLLMMKQSKINPFEKDLEAGIMENDPVNDFAVFDEEGRTIIDWG